MYGRGGENLFYRDFSPLLLYLKHHELAAGTDTEGWAPEGEALRYVDVGVRPTAIAVALFEEFVGQPRQWPHLATVGMSAEE